MDTAWKKLLLNQFHDILPGSSIAKVYEDARRDHKWIIGEAEAVKNDALASLTAGDGFTVFNSLSFPRKGLVKLPERFLNGAVTSDGKPVPVQPTAEGVLGMVTVPPCGAVCLLPGDTASENRHTARARLTETGAVIENDFVKAVLNSRGEVISFTDQTGLEYAAGPMNRLLAYKDVPRTFDAWDIDSNYIDQPVPLEEKAELTVREENGLQAVLHVSRKIMDSLWEQEIVLTAFQTRLDFVTEVDLRELHRLLKV
jgi:alpha-mannosidase